MWFTSDTHFGHRNVIAYSGRPYRDALDMDTRLVDDWNDRVRPRDEVWHLGDVALGPMPGALEVLRALHGRLHLVPGNHDRCWPHERRFDARWVAAYEAVGMSVQPTHVRLDLGGREVRLSHFPYAGDDRGRTPRHGHLRPVDDGSWLLHGHVHEQWRQRGRMVNVGVDVWDYVPVHADALVALVEAGEQHLDRHGQPVG